MKEKHLIERVMNVLFFLCGITAIGCVALITVYMVISGLPAIGKIGLIDFLFGTRWASTAADPAYGILPFILTSIYGTCGAILIGVPVGVLTAVFLSKVAPKKLAAAVAKVCGLASGACLLSAILVLALMILPNVVSTSVTALNAVPKEYEEASLALGATKIETYFKVSIPAARSGIVAGIVLGIGRAIGEAMAVIMVAGNVANMPGLFQSVTFLTTAIAKEMSYAGGLQREALFSIALVLFLFIMLINALLNLFLKGGRHDDD